MVSLVYTLFTVLPDCDFETETCGWNSVIELNGTKYFHFVRMQGKLEIDGDSPGADHHNSKEDICILVSHWMQYMPKYSHPVAHSQ